MKYLKANLFLCLLVWLFFAVITRETYAEEQHPKIDAYLQTLLSGTPDNQFLDVYLVMQDRLTYDDLMDMAHGMHKKERRAFVIRQLKQHAQITQQRVLSFLENSKIQGEVDNISVIWAINTIAFKAMPKLIYQIANNFAGVEKIFYDAHYPIEEVMDVGEITESGDIRHNGRGSRVPQAGLVLINAPAVWAEGDSGQGVIVANIDTGVDWDHPDIVHNMWNNLGEDANGNGATLIWNGASWVFDPGDVNGVDDDGNGKIDDFIGWDFDSNDNNPNDAGSHGTATSGIVVGDGTNGTQTGVAPRAKLMMLKNNSGGESGYWAAQQYAIANGADVLTSSLSYKWYFTPQPNYPQFRQMTDMELAAGMIHTNSTSNDGNSVGIPFNISAPGNCPGPWIHPDQTLVGGISSVVGCGNVVAQTDVIANSSPWGPWAWEDFQINHPSYPYPMPPQYQDYPYETQPGSMGLIKPDVAAPGNGTTSTSPGGGYSGFSGTSGATPHVAGTAALILAANPDLEPEDVSRILQTTAVEKGAPGKDNRYGAGRIDAFAAYMQAFAESGTPMAPSQFQAYSDYSIPNSMNLTWSDPTNLLNGDTLLAGFFTIQIQRDGVLIDSVPGATENFTDTGLNDGQEYTYQIFAKVDSSGRMSDPIETSWIAGGSPIPTAPLNVGINNNGSDVTIFWTNPSVNIDDTPMDDFGGVNLYQDGVLHSSFSRTPADTGNADSETVTPLPSLALTWYLTSFDNESPSNESATTDTLVTPLNAPVTEAFTFEGDLNPLYWRNENADVNTRSVDPPSLPYALNFNGKPNGGDVVELNPLDLSGSAGSGVVFAYFYQPQGSGNAPEPTDSLLVYFLNDAGEWILVHFYEGSPLQPFQQEVIDIESAPAGGGSFLHSQFQVRIRSIGSPSATTPNDDWFVDNIYLGLSTAAITASRDSFAFDSTEVGQTALDSIAIHNVGVQPLNVSGVVGSGGVFAVDTSTFTINPGASQVVRVSFTPPGAGNYAGWLKFVNNDPAHDTLSVYVEGVGFQITGIAEIDQLPLTFAVSPNYPNPFNPSTTIKYQLPQSSEVNLVIYNVLGQAVRTVVNGQVEAGYHSVVWDGRNDFGKQVSSGIYIYRFEAGDFSKVQKMIMMK